MGDDRQEKIRKRAYEIWENEGRPHGRDDFHWKQAVSEAEESGAAPVAEPGMEAGSSAAVPGQKLPDWTIAMEEVAATLARPGAGVIEETAAASIEGAAKAPRSRVVKPTSAR